MANRNTDAYVTTDMPPFAMVPLWLIRRLASEPNNTACITVFAAMHEWTNKKRTCYPSIRSIADYAGLSEPTVKRAMKTLQSVGALRVTRRPDDDGKIQSKTNLYQLLMIENDLQPSSDGGVNDDTPPGVNDATPPGGTSCDPEPYPLEVDPLNQLTHVSDIVQEAEILDDVESSWLTFWRIYPRSEGKQPARRAWAKMSDDERRLAVEAIPAHVEHWRAAKTERKFIPHAATWLNAKRWEDEFDTDYQPTGSLVQQAARYALEARRRRQHDGSTSDGSSRATGWDDDRLDRRGDRELLPGTSGVDRRRGVDESVNPFDADVD